MGDAVRQDAETHGHQVPPETSAPGVDQGGWRVSHGGASGESCPSLIAAAGPEAGGDEEGRGSHNIARHR